MGNADPGTPSRLSMHNVHAQLQLMSAARTAIIADRYPSFLRTFFTDYFGAPGQFPKWAVDALRGQGVDLLADSDNR